MKRFSIGTLMLLVVIVALGLGLMLQELRHRRREAEFQAKIAECHEGFRIFRILQEQHIRQLSDDCEERLRQHIRQLSDDYEGRLRKQADAKGQR
jgi:hypothetical protein